VFVVANRWETPDIIQIILLMALVGGDMWWRARTQARGG
jgi:hypothetical protein